MPPSPTPTPGPHLPALAPIANPFERRQLAPGAPIAQAGDAYARQGGMFFMDVATGAVEAWTLPGAYELRPLYSVSPDNRWVFASAQGSIYLADRRSGVAYRSQPYTGGDSPVLLAAQGDYLLFRQAGQVWIAGPGQPEPVPLSAGSAATWVAMAADGRTAAVLDERTLYLVHLESGAGRAIGRVDDPPGHPVESLTLQTTRRGEAFFVISYWHEGAGSESRLMQRVERYSWQGERLGELRPAMVTLWAFAPDGRWVAWEETLSQLTSAAVVADAATLTPRFRIVGASLCCHDFGTGDWLADSSGLVVRTSEGYRIVTLDGALLVAPALAGEPFAMPDEPLPAPDRADLFAVGRRAAIDAAGKALAVAALDTDTSSDLGLPADLYPWGLDSAELRFALPHLGHGGKCGEGELLLPARVEPAPFGPLVLAVGLAADDCVNLRDEPGTGAQVLGCLPGGTRLAPAPLAERPPWQEQGPYYLSLGAAWASGSPWLRVRAPDGREGWVDARAGEIGWAE